jgi:hypothetical protein
MRLEIVTGIGEIVTLAAIVSEVIRISVDYPDASPENRPKIRTGSSSS